MRHLSVVALLLGIGSAGAQQNVTTIEDLRMKILSKMNPKVPPSMGPGPWGQGNQVKVQFRVFKVLEVDIPSGRLRFKAWRRMRWLDERLKWNPVRACRRAPVDLKSVASGHSPLYMVPSQDEFDGIKTTLVYPDSPLATDLDNNLWLPDIATCDAHHTTCTHAI